MVVNSDSPLCICDFSQSCRSNGSFFLLGRWWFQNSGHLLLTFPLVNGQETVKSHRMMRVGTAIARLVGELRPRIKAAYA
jgi:hypothetical protein